MTKQREVIYEPHPVSMERKRELLASGFKIIDARFDPDRRETAVDEGEGRKDRGSKPADGDDLNTARTRYLEVFGKRPFNGWDLETVNAKLAEAISEEKAANGLTRREIAADLEAMQVEFDPHDGIEDLSALRELAREERDK
ncbi:hypothetical protein JVX98_12865 [Ensifer sp. PDNC004]|uniref:hypothetical protein n=1 Tax=Ensifer sp. PDNC004 TaxID=2811423 RepID=UPI001964E08C|nr:hypothetical protein [Ensifer sp. PDNC004]QRY69117.1 hypothetical protein JVX98_12865 [Ensifer sp. PDNC004]